MDIKQQIQELKKQMELNEIADDGYYLSLQYKLDTHTLYELEKQLQRKKCDE